jgi:hypothetical protein
MWVTWKANNSEKKDIWGYRSRWHYSKNISFDQKKKRRIINENKHSFSILNEEVRQHTRILIYEKNTQYAPFQFPAL